MSQPTAVACQNKTPCLEEHAMLRVPKRMRMLSTVVGFLAATCCLPAFSLDLDQKVDFNIPAQELGAALIQFSQQADVQIIVSGDIRGETTQGVSGEHAIKQALSRLLGPAGLSYRVASDTSITVGKAESIAKAVEREMVRVAQSEAPSVSGGSSAKGGDQSSGNDNQSSAATVENEEKEGSEGKGIPEILVTGSKIRSLNADIRRTEDDIQPYKVFDRERIEASGVSSIEEFFKNELTMSTNVLTAGQNESVGNRSNIDLRGLGTDETLILIDGRRMAGFSYNGTPQQPDINGIPLAAIERIEVLPTTASGIYGGGATGGVINIVLRRDYFGLETRLTYGNTFESDATTHRVDLSAGFNLEGGKTNVLLTGSYSDVNALLSQERDFVRRGRQHISATNPTFYLNAFNPPLGATPNIRSSTGSALILDDGTPINSPITFVPKGYAGTATDGGIALAANAGQYNLDLADTAQQGARRHGILSQPQVKSTMMALRREFTPRVQGFLELQASESSTVKAANYTTLVAVIPGDAPTNPFQQSIRVNVPTISLDGEISSEAKNHRAVAGMIAQLPREWQLAVDFTWNRSRSSYSWPPNVVSGETQAAISRGELDVLRDINQFSVPLVGATESSQSPGDMKLKNTALRLAGPLPWSLPGGAPVLSALVERRDESLSDLITVCCGGGRSLIPARSQTVESAYLEARIPLISAQNRRPAAETLELQLALRADDYSVTGATPGAFLDGPLSIERVTRRSSSVDPTFGLRYQPIPDLTLRTSYGTGYLPPSMMQLIPDPAFPRDLAASGIVTAQAIYEPWRLKNTPCHAAV